MLEFSYDFFLFSKNIPGVSLTSSSDLILIINSSRAAKNAGAAIIKNIGVIPSNEYKIGKKAIINADALLEYVCSKVIVRYFLSPMIIAKRRIAMIKAIK